VGRCCSSWRASRYCGSGRRSHDGFHQSFWNLPRLETSSTCARLLSLLYHGPSTHVKSWIGSLHALKNVLERPFGVRHFPISFAFSEFERTDDDPRSKFNTYLKEHSPLDTSPALLRTSSSKLWYGQASGEVHMCRQSV
jgi:hypothetical protein